MAVSDRVDARKHPLGKRDALKLAKAAARVVVANRKNIVIWDMERDHPDDATLLRHLLGPTGNLRAPAVQKCKTLLIGFCDQAFSKWPT